MLILLSDEDLGEYGLIGPEENQDEAQEVPDTSTHLPGCPGQGLHQRYADRTLLTCEHVEVLGPPSRETEK